MKELVGEGCYVYIDDVIISKTAEEYTRRLANVLDRFNKANLQLHPVKWVFAETKVNYLGYALTQNGVSALEDKVAAVKNYSPLLSLGMSERSCT